jgi:hypothetical protein
MSTLAQLLDAPDTTRAALESHLDALATGAKIDQTRALGKRQLSRLWDLCDGGKLVMDEIVPPTANEDQTFEFAGRNSLAMFSNFEKHFAKHGDQIVGFNMNWHGAVSGWGSFTCDIAPARPDEVRFDYTALPKGVPSSWPSVRPHKGLISYFTYHNQYDYNRRVAKDVVIGCATILDKPRGAWYVLVRKS